jgi:hypothetical protein
MTGNASDQAQTLTDLRVHCDTDFGLHPVWQSTPSKGSGFSEPKLIFRLKKPAKTGELRRWLEYAPRSRTDLPDLTVIDKL